MEVVVIDPLCPIFIQLSHNLLPYLCLWRGARATFSVLLILEKVLHFSHIDVPISVHINLAEKLFDLLFVYLGGIGRTRQDKLFVVDTAIHVDIHIVEYVLPLLGLEVEFFVHLLKSVLQFFGSQIACVRGINCLEKF